MNIIECGTGVKPNPNFDFYDSLNYYESYKDYCLRLYDLTVSQGDVLRTERWSDFDVERKKKIIKEVIGYCTGFKGQIDLHFAGKLQSWGNDTYEVIFGVVKDLAGI